MHSGKCDQSIIYRKTNTPGAATSGVFYAIWRGGLLAYASDWRLAVLFVFVQPYPEKAADYFSCGREGK